jgi:hypothetical protein
LHLKHLTFSEKYLNLREKYLNIDF